MGWGEKGRCPKLPLLMGEGVQGYSILQGTVWRWGSHITGDKVCRSWSLWGLSCALVTLSLCWGLAQAHMQMGMGPGLTCLFPAPLMGTHSHLSDPTGPAQPFWV